MKDPAVLFFISDWLTSTAEMDSDCRGWYLNLILHQYDKKDLPDDIEKLAVLAGVKFSEFERFKQVFENEIKSKLLNNNILAKNPEQKEFFHWNWKGGITPINVKIRNSNKYINWRKEIFYRDKYKCVECGKTNCKLNAHHILSFSKYKNKRFDINNGITLCEECHKKKHNKLWP